MSIILPRNSQESSQRLPKATELTLITLNTLMMINDDVENNRVTLSKTLTTLVKQLGEVIKQSEEAIKNEDNIND